MTDNIRSQLLSMCLIQWRQFVDKGHEEGDWDAKERKRLLNAAEGVTSFRDFVTMLKDKQGFEHEAALDFLLSAIEGVDTYYGSL